MAFLEVKNLCKKYQMGETEIIANNDNIKSIGLLKYFLYILLPQPFNSFNYSI